MEISLDEYIRRNQFGDQFSLLNHRKRDQNIDEDNLNKDLAEYIRQAQGGSSYESSTKRTSELGKFERFEKSDDDSDEDDSFNPKPLSKISEDVDMEDFSEKNSESHENEPVNTIDDLFFQTTESKYGVRVRSQQWRLLQENLEERPEGMKRLEFLPLDEEERFKRVQSGRIERNRSRTSSFSSNFSKRGGVVTEENIRAQGHFIEKGSFTIKYGDRNGTGEKGVIGIERAKRIDQPAVNPPPGHVSVPQTTPQVTINMNWEGFFKGMKSAQNLIPKEPEDTDEKLNIAAVNLLRTLREKRNEEVEMLAMREEVAEIQGRPLEINNAGNKNIYNRFI